MQRALLLTMVLLPTNLAASSQDLGFAELFTTHNASIDEVCIAFSAPSYLQGTFVLPSLGQFEMAQEKFTGLLDGFGKLARFTIANQSLCYQSRMMDTNFYNASMQAGKIAPGLMFDETAPPRNYSGLQNLAGFNDNVFVNTYSLGTGGERSHFRCVTDSQTSMEFDPLTLHMVGSKIKWEDKMDFGNLPIGSAHPLPHPHKAGCILNVHPQTAFYMLGHQVSVYQMCNDAPFSRKRINAIHTPYMPYLHSWGLTSSTVVLPMMPFTLNFIDVMKGNTLSKSFQDIPNSSNDTTIHLMPIDGSAPTSVVLVGMSLYYTHVVNAYDDVDAVTGHRIHVMDVVQFSNNPFNGEMAELALYRNKTARDVLDPASGAVGIPTRLVIDAVTMTATASAMKGFDVAQKGPMAMMETDFPKINPNVRGQKYCLFWAVQWRTNYPKEISYAQMGIIKYNVCTHEYVVWKKENCYPSEPTFVPNNNKANAAEDDGVLVFTVLNGATNTSSFITVDAKTMKTVGNATVPDTIGFTTHGQFYQHLKK